MDFDDFIFFVSVFRNPDARHTHHHEDTLSYVLYSGVDEVLVDPGRASFAPADSASPLGPVHNGLSDAMAPLAPLRRFFFNHRMRSEPVSAGAESRDRGIFLWAQSPLFGLRKELRIHADGAQSMVIDESIEWGGNSRRAPVFSHLFADEDVKQISSGALRHAASGCTIVYETQTAQPVRLATAERSPAYNHRMPCLRAILPCATNKKQAKLRWRITRT